MYYHLSSPFRAFFYCFRSRVCRQRFFSVYNIRQIALYLPFSNLPAVAREVNWDALFVRPHLFQLLSSTHSLLVSLFACAPAKSDPLSPPPLNLNFTWLTSLGSRNMSLGTDFSSTLCHICFILDQCFSYLNLSWTTNEPISHRFVYSLSLLLCALFRAPTKCVQNIASRIRAGSGKTGWQEQ